MRSVKRTLAVFCCCFVPTLAWVGCGGDDSPTPPVEEPTGLTDSEAQISAQMSQLTSLLYQIGSLASLSAQQVMLAGDPGFTSLDGDCPEVVVGSVGATHLEMDLDYGDGCMTDWGFSATGLLGVSFAASETVDEIAVEFTSFSVEGYTMDGDLALVGRGPSWTYSFDGVVAGLYQLTAEYDVAFDDRGTPLDWTDDVATVDGGGVVTVGPILLTLRIEEPLAYSVGCQNSTTGILEFELSSEPGSVTALAFDTGSCCTATATVGTRTGEVSLCSVGALLR